MRMTFKNRIAFHYMLATALIIAVAFGVVFVIVKATVYNNLDHDLSYEARKHATELYIKGDSILFINKAEWEEREHREVQVNPVFIQVMDDKGRIMDRSPNLKEQQLFFAQTTNFGDHFDSELNHRPLRQVQLPIKQNNQLKGYLVAAMSLESSKMVVRNLKNVLLISFPVVLLGLFIVSRYLAGKNIVPIKNITHTTNLITRNNLNERVSLPHNKDELYDLTASINELLSRIENAMQRERQFTSDASHELRTPLSTLRGTLEVLIRKPRTQEEYEAKIKYSLSEIDRMTAMTEQLLLLARFESRAQLHDQEKITLITVVDESLSKYRDEIEKKNLKIDFDHETGEALVEQYYSNLIIDNIISNAIKYSPEDSRIKINVETSSEYLICRIADEGIGIREEDLERLFNPMFRSDALKHKDITGTGLGLSIARKAADAIGARIQVNSKPGDGSVFTILFKEG